MKSKKQITDAVTGTREDRQLDIEININYEFMMKEFNPFANRVAMSFLEKYKKFSEDASS